MPHALQTGAGVTGRHSLSSKTPTRRFGSIVSGFRYYNPSVQRWINRDPLGEGAGVNLYRFVRNNAVGALDSLGLQAMPSPEPGPPIHIWEPPTNIHPLPVVGAPVAVIAGEVCSVVAGVVAGGAIIYILVCNSDTINNPPVTYPPYLPGQRNCPPIGATPPKGSAGDCQYERADPNFCYYWCGPPGQRWLAVTKKRFANSPCDKTKDVTDVTPVRPPQH
jgi:RHS repeat-associated protein